MQTASGCSVCNVIGMPSSNYTEFNEAALESLFRENFKPLCAYCQYKFGFDTDIAKETVHTAFIRLWENRKTVSPDLSVKAYLSKIVNNTSLDMLKHERVKQKYAMQMLQNSPAQASGKDFQEAALKRLEYDIDQAVAALPAQMRTVFELSRYEELKYAAIAARLGISVKTVETQMSRALAKLREKLANYLVIFLCAFLLKILS